MRTHIENLLTKINKLSLRERMILTVLLCSSAIGLINFFAASPLQEGIDVIKQDISMKEESLKNTHATLKELISAKSPDEIRREKENEIEREIQLTYSKLESLRLGIITSKTAPDWLRSMVPDNKRVELLRIKKIGSEPLFKVNAHAKAARPLLYKHALEVQLRGSYQDLVAYMKNVEHSKHQVYWESALLDGTNSPTCILILNFAIVSTDEKWILL